MSDDTPKSDFQLAIEARHGARVEHPYDVDGFFGLGNKPVPKIAVRNPTLLEKIQAIDEAYKLVKKLCNEPEARQDPIVFEDLKVTCLVSRAIRTIGSTSKHSYPAFGGPEWMAANMSGDQIAALTALVNTVQRRESTSPVEISDEAVEALATSLGANAGREDDEGQRVNDVLLAGIKDRELLNFCIEAISNKLMTTRADLAAYVKEQGIKDTLTREVAPEPEPEPTT